jgi:hypothetical protein
VAIATATATATATETCNQQVVFRGALVLLCERLSLLSPLAAWQRLRERPASWLALLLRWCCHEPPVRALFRTVGRLTGTAMRELETWMLEAMATNPFRSGCPAQHARVLELLGDMPPSLGVVRMLLLGLIPAASSLAIRRRTSATAAGLVTAFAATAEAADEGSGGGGLAAVLTLFPGIGALFAEFDAAVPNANRTCPELWAALGHLGLPTAGGGGGGGGGRAPPSTIDELMAIPPLEWHFAFVMKYCSREGWCTVSFTAFLV